ncbi:hypothetical protein IFR05_012743 [Cadophora sp. M221]|nr:hypothetical protein IFR05_012743 [Cadophora sp. M221]
MATRTCNSTTHPVSKLEGESVGAIRLMGTSCQINVPPGKMVVKIPDMFNSCMFVAPRVNPFYEEVKLEAEEWISKKLGSAKMKKVISKTDFAWFCAVAVPDAGKEELRTMCDWGNWVFPFDDIFDNGKLKDNPQEAREVMDDLLLVMRGGVRASEPSAFIEIHDSVWDRIVKISSTAVQNRFLTAMTEYCNGALEHVGHHSEAKLPILSEYLQARRRAVGVTPVIALMEYALRLEMLDSVCETEAFEKLKIVVIDIILIQNDIISYKKEEAEGVPHNLITVLRNGGMNTQEAFNRAGEMLEERSRDWELIKTEFPRDVDARNYIEGTRNIMLASLHWHFRSERYFGEMKDDVREHGMIVVNQDPRMMETGVVSVSSPGVESWIIYFWKRIRGVLDYF